MYNYWDRKFDFIYNSASTQYLLDDRNTIIEEKLLNNYDIYFKYQKCLSSITYSYINDLKDIYKKTFLIDGYSINNMYNEYNIIDKYLNNYHKIDIAVDYNIDINETYYKLDNIILSKGHKILLINQNDKKENGVYIVKWQFIFTKCIYMCKELFNGTI